MKIISGGQTGADRAGLEIGKELGLETGGWMPKGFLAQDGYHPEFAQLYGIQEHESPKYGPRTYCNVRDSDGTVRIASDFGSPGEILTLKAIHYYEKPWFNVPIEDIGDPKVFIDWIKKYNIKTLNVAGNSERTSPGINKIAKEFLRNIIQQLN